jgi:hypothetical protein
MRTARSRTSGENLVVFFMAPSSQELEPPQNPGRFSLSIRAAVETAIFTSSTTSRKDESMTPTRPTQMTAGEAAELEQFKASLPNAIINAELDQRAQAINGGAAGVAQKERVTAMLQANNQHFKK